MSLITLDEAAAELQSSIVDEDSVANLIGGLSVALERACNRRFAMRVSDVSTSNSVVTFKIPHHRLEIGDIVYVSVIGGGELEGYATVTGVEPHEFTISNETGSVDSMIASVRKVRTQYLSTSGESCVFVPHLPLASVYSLSYKDSEATWVEYATSDYVVPDKVDELSYSGEIALLEKFFPRSRAGGRHPEGARVRYVVGEPFPKADIVYAMKGLVKQAKSRLRKSQFSSESYDYYSYSRLSASEIGKLFGEADRIIRDNRIPVI